MRVDGLGMTAPMSPPPAEFGRFPLSKALCAPGIVRHWGEGDSEAHAWIDRHYGE